MENSFSKNILNAIRAYASKYPSLRAAAQDLGITYETFRSWHNEVKSPTIESLSPYVEKLGLRLANSQQGSNNSQAVQKAKNVSMEEYSTPAKEENFVAIPILGEVGAGPGHVPEIELEDWFMVSRDAIRGRDISQLLAVRIATHSIAMQPTLNPHDIVLVDTDDKNIGTGGNIMLVLDPIDRSSMVKRVSAREVRGDVHITFYTDNTSQYPPLVYSLMEDFDGEWHKAIVGKVIWAWTDMRGK